MAMHRCVNSVELKDIFRTKHRPYVEWKGQVRVETYGRNAPLKQGKWGVYLYEKRVYLLVTYKEFTKTVEHLFNFLNLDSYKVREPDALCVILTFLGRKAVASIKTKTSPDAKEIFEACNAFFEIAIGARSPDGFVTPKDARIAIKKEKPFAKWAGQTTVHQFGRIPEYTDGIWTLYVYKNQSFLFIKCARKKTVEEFLFDFSKLKFFPRSPPEAKTLQLEFAEPKVTAWIKVATREAALELYTACTKMYRINAGMEVFTLISKKVDDDDVSRMSVKIL